MDSLVSVLVIKESQYKGDSFVEEKCCNSDKKCSSDHGKHDLEVPEEVCKLSF